MAQKRTIDIDINTNADEAAKQFDTLATGVKKAADSAENLDAKFEDVFQGVEPLTTRLGEAEDRLYELALAGDTTSKEYQELLTKVGEYRKVQIQTDLAVDAAATTMGQKLGGALGGATSGFAAVQGAMGLVGAESVELEKTLLKVQSALAIQQGVQGIREAIPSFKQLGNVASQAFANMTKGAKAFALTGIGLLTTALAVLIVKFDDIQDAFDNTTQKQKDLNSTTEAYVTAQKNATIEVEKVGAAFELAKEGVISKDDALKQYNDTLGDSLGAATSLNEAEELYEQKTEDYIRATALRAQANALFEKAAQANADALAKSLELETQSVAKVAGGGLAGFLIDATGISKQANKEFTAARKQQIKDEGQRRADQLNELAKDLLKESALISNSAGINTKKRTESAKNTAKELEDVENEILRKRFESLENGLVKAKALRALDLKEEIEALDKRNISTKQKNELLKFINKQFKEDVAEINAFYADQEIAAIEVQAATEIEITKQTNEEIELQMAQSAARQKAIDDKLAEDKKLNAMKVADAQLSIAHDSLGAIGELANAFAKDDEKNAKKAFNINKAVGIAQAVVSTAQGIMAQLAVPQDALTGANFIKAGIVAATGAAQIATISASKFQGGGGETPSLDASGGEAQAPSFNVVGDSGINQLASLKSEPIKAFVVSGEVTTSQALDRNRVENATL